MGARDQVENTEPEDIINTVNTDKGGLVENIYETLLEQMSDGVFLADPDDHYVLVNDQACRMLGYTREELLGRGMSDIVAPADLDATPLRIDAMRSGKTVFTERHMVRKDGSQILVEVSAKMLSNGYFQGVVRDITARKQAEEALRVSDANMQAILNNSAISYVLMDANQRIITANRIAQIGAQTVFGRSIQPGDLFTEFLTESTHDSFYQNFQLALHGAVVLSEVHFDTPKGQTRYFDFRYFPAIAADGTVLGVCLSSQDMTEQKQARIALQESEQKFRVLSEQSLLGIRIMQDNRFRYANQAMADIIGYALEEVTGWAQIDFSKMIHPDDLAFAVDQAQRKQTGDSEVTTRYNYRIITRDGQVRWIEQFSKTIEFDGRLANLVTIIDITERKNAEAKRDQAEDALAKERNLLRTVVDLLPDNIFAKDVDGRFLLNNAVSLKMLGVARQEDALGKTDFDFWPRTIAEESRAHELAILASGQPMIDREEFQPWEADTWRWLTFSTIPLRDEQGTIIGLVGVTHDISERKRTDELLAQERRLLRNVIDILPDNIFLKDVDGRFLLNNTVSLQMLGVSRQEEALGKTDFDLLRLDLAELSRVDELKVLNSGQPIIEQELFQPWEPDTWRWLTYSLIPLRDEQGAIFGLLGMTHDISKIKQAEELLAKERNLLRNVIDILPDNIFVKDRDSRFVLNNPVSMSLLGVSRQEDLIGKSDFDFFPPEVAEKWRKQEQAIVQSGQALRDKEVYEPGRIDNRVWVVVSIIPMRDAQGEVFGLLGFSRDITEQKLADIQLRAAHDLLEQRVIARTAELEASKRHVEAILNNSPEGILLLAPDLRIRLVNPAIERLFGSQPDEYLNQSLLDLFQEPVAKDILALVQGLAAGSASQQIETVAQRKDGSIFHAEFSINYFPDGGLVCTISDITVRKQADDALRQALITEKKLGELKTQFVSMASHEFRTPLATILATADTLSAYRHQMDDNQIEQKFVKIREQVGYLKDIMDDVLFLARMQARRVEFSPVMSNLDEFCRSVINEFQSRPDIHHQLAYTVDGPTRNALLDKKLMRQIISNLIANAIKYSSPEKTINIRLGFTQEAAELTVSDQGIGIPAGDQPHLFEPFVRASNVGAISGTGLGLVIMKDSVEMHGGDITFDSQVGVGTTFTVRIPLTIGKQSIPIKTALDDEPVNRD